MPVDTISGKYLAVVIGNVVIVGAQEWTCRETTDQLDGTTGADQGYENDDNGLVRAEIDIMLVQNLASGIYAAVRAGTLLTNLKLYRTSADNQPAFTIPLAKVYESTNAGKVRDRFTTAVKARSKGPYSGTDPGAG